MIGIIAAMEDEMSLLKEKMNTDSATIICGIKFYEGIIGTKEVVLCSSGVGKVNSAMAATILIEVFNCDLIINTGIAGGINGVNTKDIIIAKELCYSDVDATAFGYQYGQVPGMPFKYIPNPTTILKLKTIFNKLNINYKEACVYSADSFVSKLEQLKNVDINILSIAEMEGTSIAQVCVRSGVDFIVLRYVSDIVGKENQIEDYQEFEREMAYRSSNICLELINNFE